MPGLQKFNLHKYYCGYIVGIQYEVDDAVRRQKEGMVLLEVEKELFGGDRISKRL
jgi:hypothetical protein